MGRGAEFKRALPLPPYLSIFREKTRPWLVSAAISSMHKAAVMTVTHHLPMRRATIRFWESPSRLIPLLIWAAEDLSGQSSYRETSLRTNKGYPLGLLEMSSSPQCVRALIKMEPYS